MTKPTREGGHLWRAAYEGAQHHFKCSVCGVEQKFVDVGRPSRKAHYRAPRQSTWQLAKAGDCTRVKGGAS